MTYQYNLHSPKPHSDVVYKVRCKYLLTGKFHIWYIIQELEHDATYQVLLK